jgi:hypothetical protein
MIVFFCSLQCLLSYAQDEIEAPATDSISYFDAVDTTIPIKVEERKVPGDVLTNLKEDDAFWYANAAQEKKKVAPTGDSFLTQLLKQAWFWNLLWVIIVSCFTIIVIWFLAVSNLQLFRTKPKGIKEEAAEHLTDDIFAINFDAEIDRTIQTGHYRLAVRLLYLQVLKKLSDATVINYGIEKTNSDYLAQLHNTAYYNDFFKLTRHFEYVWYGQFSLSQPVFNLIHQQFTFFNKRLPA